MSKKGAAARITAGFVLLVTAFAVMLILNVNTGSVSISPGEILRILLRGGADGSREGNVIWKIRLPRLLAAAVLGGALSVSGFLLQNFFRNPIAGPYVLGISSGAKMLVGAVMILGLKYFSAVPFWAMIPFSSARIMLLYRSRSFSFALPWPLMPVICSPGISTVYSVSPSEASNCCTTSVAFSAT